MSIPVTTILAGYFGIMLVVLSTRVVGARRSASGDNEEEAAELITRRVRGQANFAEYVPMALVLFALLELQGFNSAILIILAVLFAFGRTIHGYAFAFTNHWVFGRLYGTAITFGVIALLGAIAIVVGLMAAFG